jgi:aryl-alcohol dehydrogenase-like predicted oxidoreductase
MKRRRLPSTNLEVSPLCLGVLPFGTIIRGGDMYRLYDTFREAGGNFFDTAHCYCFWIKRGHGASERALGECIRGAGDRAEVVVATKGGHPAVPPQYPRPDWYQAPEVIARDVQDSLERLGVEQIDLYYLHRDDLRLPVGEIIGALNEQIASGRVRYLGASNWSTARIAEANAYAAKHGLLGFVASEPHWNLAVRHQMPDPTMRLFNDEDEHWHARHLLPVVPYTPTAGGYFASNGERAKDAFENPASRARLMRARELAKRLEVTPNQVALAWLMSHPFPVVPILGTTKVDHLMDGLGAADVRLTAEQVRWLRDG